MALRAALVVGLERIRVRAGVRGQRVRVISVQPLPAPPTLTESVIITVETVDEGVRLRASAQVLAQDVMNYRFVIKTMTEALRRALSLQHAAH